MTTYHVLNLVISGLVAIGTCGATVLVLYFWWDNKRIKLKINAMHADSFGDIPKTEDGFFVVNVFCNRTNMNLYECLLNY